MIIAHLPAGYLLTKILSPKFPRARRARLWLCGLFAALMPDLDIIWFHIEGGVRNHRYYLTHWPLFWLALFALALALLWLARRRDLFVYPTVMLANVMLHLALDLIAAPVFYAAPFTYDYIQLVRVPAVHSWWVWNFIRHWTFQLELMIWGAAVAVFCLSRWDARRLRGAGGQVRPAS